MSDRREHLLGAEANETGRMTCKWHRGCVILLATLALFTFGVSLESLRRVVTDKPVTLEASFDVHAQCTRGKRIPGSNNWYSCTHPTLDVYSTCGGYCCCSAGYEVTEDHTGCQQCNVDGGSAACFHAQWLGGLEGTGCEDGLTTSRYPCTGGAECGGDGYCYCRNTCAGISSDGAPGCFHDQSVRVANGFSLQNVWTQQYLTPTSQFGLELDKSRSALWDLYQLPCGEDTCGDDKSDDPPDKHYFLAPSSNNRYVLSYSRIEAGGAAASLAPNSIYLADLGANSQVGFDDPYYRYGTVRFCKLRKTPNQVKVLLGEPYAEGFRVLSTAPYDITGSAIEWKEDNYVDSTVSTEAYWFLSDDEFLKTVPSCAETVAEQASELSDWFTNDLKALRDCFEKLPDQFSLGTLFDLGEEVVTSMDMTPLYETYIQPVYDSLSQFNFTPPPIHPSQPGWALTALDVMMQNIKNLTDMPGFEPVHCLVDVFLQPAFDTSKETIAEKIEKPVCSLQSGWNSLISYGGEFTMLENCIGFQLSPDCAKFGIGLQLTELSESGSDGSLLNKMLEQLKNVGTPILEQECNDTVKSIDDVAKQVCHTLMVNYTSLLEDDDSSSDLSQRFTKAGIEAHFNTVWPKISNYVTNLVDPVVNEFQALADNAFTAVAHALDGLAGLIPEMGALIAAAITNGLSMIVKKFLAVFAVDVKYILTCLLDQLGAEILNFIHGLEDATKAGSDDLSTNLLAGAPDAVSQMVDSVWGFVLSRVIPVADMKVDECRQDWKQVKKICVRV